MENSKDTTTNGRSTEFSNEENRIQAMMVQWFNNTYCLKHHSPRYVIFSIPNGGTRNKLEAMTLKATGLLAGASDLVLVMDKIYFIEVKTNVGIQSDVQKDFQKRVQKLGHEYKLIRSLDEFKLWIQSLTTNN